MKEITEAVERLRQSSLTLPADQVLPEMLALMGRLCAILERHTHSDYAGGRACWQRDAEEELFLRAFPEFKNNPK